MCMLRWNSSMKWMRYSDASKIADAAKCCNGSGCNLTGAKGPHVR